MNESIENKSNKNLKAWQELLRWSAAHFSGLPWRTPRRDLYSTLVSEIMLQQTTVSTVLKHFDRFMTRFPTLRELALAPESEVLLAFQGLGYYRRARNLHHAAQYIYQHLKGNFPQTAQELEEIPGIGPYTAQALLGIGGDQPALCLDANLERVLSRVYALKDPKGMPLKKKLMSLFREQKILGREMLRLSSRALNEALMDLGRTVCVPRAPRCESCALRTLCRAYQLHLRGELGAIGPEFFPYDMSSKQSQEGSEANSKNKLKVIKEQKGQKFFSLQLLRFYVRKGDQLLLYQKSDREWLTNQWEVPTFILQSEDLRLKQYPVLAVSKVTKESSLNLNLKDKLKNSIRYKSTITKYKIENKIVALSEKEFLSFLKQWKKINIISQDRIEFKDLKSPKLHLATSVHKMLKSLS